MDADGSGDIGYAEFTLLSEERWREIDPYKKYKAGVQSYENYIKTATVAESEKSIDENGKANVSSMGVRVNDQSGHMTLESLAKNHLKIPIRKQSKDIGFENINRRDP